MFNHIWSKATALASSGVMLALTSSYAAASSAVLKPDDFVGISFWLISMALIASTGLRRFWANQDSSQTGQPHRQEESSVQWSL